MNEFDNVYHEPVQLYEGRESFSGYVTRSDVQSFISLLGFDPKDVKEIVISPFRIDVYTLVYNEHGRCMYDTDAVVRRSGSRIVEVNNKRDTSRAATKCTSLAITTGGPTNPHGTVVSES